MVGSARERRGMIPENVYGAGDGAPADDAIIARNPQKGKLTQCLFGPLKVFVIISVRLS